MRSTFDDCPDRPIIPISSTPGGVIDPDHLIGRGVEIEAISEAVTGNGAIVLGDRRMGKTSLLRKMGELLGDSGYVVVSLSAETTKPETFGERLIDALQRHARFRSELRNWSVAIDVNVRGVSLRRTARNGSTNTDDLFEWAARHTAPDRLVLIIDEITVLVGALGSSPADAAEFLHSFRRARQENPNLTMVLAGSIGLHHVVDDLSTINDLAKIRVDALDACDALHLARCLMAGNDVDVDEEVARALVTSTDGIPYFMHHLVNGMRKTDGFMGVDEVDQLVDRALRDPLDPWDVKHYRDRLASYYGDDGELAGACLDLYALAGALTIDELLTGLGSVDLETRPKRHELAGLVEKLEADHYLEPLGDGSDRFASSIIHRAWIAIRRLT